MFLVRLLTVLKAKKIPYALCGGFAVALHGAVRGTVDVDLVISLQKSDFQKVAAALRELGLVSRLPVNAEQVFDFREEWIKSRNLIAWSFYHPAKPSEQVDILLNHDLRKLKTVRLAIYDLKVSVLSIESLMKTKSGTGRAQDEADIEALKQLKRKK